MFKTWGVWGGTEEQQQQQQQQQGAEVNKQSVVVVAESDEDPPPLQLFQKAKGFSDYIYNFASSASRKLSESVVETAQSLKKSVEDGKINGIIDKTILGEFQKEQEKFVQEKKAKASGAAVPPWVGYNEEETIQQQILALSADKRNFLRDPPAGVHFSFDFQLMHAVALVMLEEDELLRKMRFHLVPKQVKEETFWRNYFYRVSLIKQSAQLTALANQQAAQLTALANQQAAARSGEETPGAASDARHIKDVVKRDVPRVAGSNKPKSREDQDQDPDQDQVQDQDQDPDQDQDQDQDPDQDQDQDQDQVSTSPSEFVSDAFDSSSINQDDLRKEMEQLVLDTQKEEMPDWERELQEELQEYDVLDRDQDQDQDPNWDKEIEEMLMEES